MKTRNSTRNLVFFIFLLMSVLHIPTGFGKSSSSAFIIPSLSTKEVNITALLYTQLSLDSLGLSKEAYSMAINGFKYLKSNGKLLNENIISIVDFSKSSATKRLFVIDVASGSLLFNTYVAHGQNSGYLMAEKFSNKISSLQSSLGFYETASTYKGKNGYSLKLDGLEKGINDNAMERSIVMHGAPYVSERNIKLKGYLGRSWGCPAVSEKLSKPIIDKIKNGSCFFVYAKSATYAQESKFLRS